MTFRPLGPRIVAYVAGACLVVLFVAVAAALSPEIRAAFTVLQTGTLVLFLLALLAVLWGIARSRVETSDEGITIVNGYRVHRLGWDEVVDVSLDRGAPWGSVTAHGDRRYALLGIQAADGPRATHAMWLIREQVIEHSDGA